MKIRSQLLVPIIITLIIVLGIGFVGINWVLKSLVNDQSTRFTSFMTSSMENAARAKIEEITNNLDRIGQAALQQVSPFSRLPEVISAYELAHSGNINDENSPQSQQAREQLRNLYAPPLPAFRPLPAVPILSSTIICPTVAVLRAHIRTFRSAVMAVSLTYLMTSAASGQR